MNKFACLSFFLWILTCASAHGPHGHYHHEDNNQSLVNSNKRNLIRKQRDYRGESDFNIATFATDVIKAGINGKGWKGNAPFSFDGTFFKDSGDLVKSGKACKTQDLEEERRKEIDEEVRNFIRQKFGSTGIRHLQATEMVINVYIHVVYKSSSTDPTNVSDAMINKQLKILNDSYKGVHAEYTKDCSGNTIPNGVPTPFRFNLKAITRTLNSGWHGGLQDQYMVPALRVGSCSDLNIFINNAQGHLGYASFASACKRNNLAADFVAIHWSTLPGASNTPFSEGDTMVHEVGHWLGAEHTFQGGCTSEGDKVSDTVPELVAAFGCPIGRDTCPGNGTDPIWNFMDYTDDCCMHTFSTGQNTRMMEQVLTYRNITFTTPPPSTPVLPPMSWPVSIPVSSAPTAIGPSTCTSGKFKVEVIMNFDEYAEETSYKIVQTSSNTVVNQFQGLVSQSKSRVIKSSCLDNTQMYFFVISDSYGDGMQGYNTLGTWQLKVNGNVKGSGGSFEREDLLMFGPTSGCSGTTDQPFTLVVQADDYGSESSHILSRMSNNEVVSRSRSFTSNTLNLVQVCLSSGDYRSRFRDSSADGMCCGYGSGYYAIYLTRSLINKSSEFGSTNTVYFTVV